ncbi:Surfactin synthase thioesterase subunit [Clostridium sp. DSM 8431]|uniref:phosphopantetheine-binding protein n=1 Tax=Clostridium sp. DSM 8431 TaxID=1761781 RepID=UPI0008E71330|nr:phosphopantetheine-binding protein [Clostridium sp. DSM 8431]SFU55644.1 Surfactin synthase thioesterase subunit [Clostridium sp. DSM 8431]
MEKCDLKENVTCEKILSTFSEVLGNVDISSNDNFFDLGGDSFDAIRVIAKLGNNLRIVDIFENPTAEKLFKYIEGKAYEKKARLVQLKANKSEKKASVVIGVPYGGGDPTIFKNMFEDNDNIGVYGVDFGNIKVESQQELEVLLNKIVMEIEEIAMDKKIIIYGHCAGASTATCIAAILKNRDHMVKLVIAAAKPVKDIENSILEAKKTSDYEWSEYLRTLGGFTGLNDEEIKEMMSRGRRDHFLSVEGYRWLSINDVKNIETLLILGDKDEAISDIKEVVNEWDDLVNVNEVKVLKEVGHYFIRTHYEEVSKIILQFI